MQISVLLEANFRSSRFHFLPLLLGLGPAVVMAGMLIRATSHLSSPGTLPFVSLALCCC